MFPRRSKGQTVEVMDNVATTNEFMNVTVSPATLTFPLMSNELLIVENDTNGSVSPTTLKCNLPSNDLLPVTHVTLANTEANVNQNSDNIMDPINENVMNETVCPSTLKFPPPSYDLLPVSHDTLAKTKAYVN